IAAPATHIQHTATVEAEDVRGEPVPLPVAPPLGVHSHASEVPGALAPGFEFCESRFQGRIISGESGDLYAPVLQDRGRRLSAAGEIFELGQDCFVVIGMTVAAGGLPEFGGGLDCSGEPGSVKL